MPSAAKPVQLIVADFGVFLGKKSERLMVKKDRETLQELPFHNIESIVVMNSGVSLSSDMIQECMEHGIQIDFLTPSGKPYAKLTSPSLSGTVITRREQLLAYQDLRGVRLAKAFVEGKIRNQVSLMKYFAKYRKTVDQELYDEIYREIERVEKTFLELKDVKGKLVDEVREELLSIEGRVGEIYWGVVRKVIGERIDFVTREHRGADDPFNSLLNYGYGILYSQVWGAVILAGLEPFAGYLHVDRPGRASLILDLIEEFRQQVVDRTVIAMVNRGIPIKLEEGRLVRETRQKLSEDISERLEGRELYRGKKQKLKTIIQLQARRIATFVRGGSDYKPFVGGW